MWLQQMVLTVDGEGRGARYQMQTSGVQGPGQAASNRDGSFGPTFPHTEMEPGCLPKQQPPGSGFSCKALSFNCLRPC